MPYLTIPIFRDPLLKILDPPLHRDMTQNPTRVTITQLIFMNKKLLVFTRTRQTA